MNQLSTFGYRSEPLIINQEDSVSAIDATCQLGTDHENAGQIDDHKEQSEPGWDGAAAAKHGLRKRPLTRAQLAFVEGVVRGETHKAAYRAAYPGDSSTDASISTSASKLLRDQRIQKALRDAQEDDPERLLDDPAAMKRYVMTQLLRCASQFKQEGSKIKALELIGKAAGIFRPEVEPQAPSVTPEQLKRDLSRHFAYLDNAVPSGLPVAELSTSTDRLHRKSI